LSHLSSHLFGRYRANCRGRAGLARAYRRRRGSIVVRSQFLEHDQCGRRYGPTANLPGAIGEYRKMLKEGVYENGRENLTFALAMALMHCEKFSEAQQLLTESDKMPLMNPINLAIAMIEQGPATARDKAEKLAPDVQKRGELLKMAEHYGLHDVAVSLYNKVTRPRRPIANDSYALAQRRLEILALSPSASPTTPP
jgi:hypothetical protein